MSQKLRIGINGLGRTGLQAIRAWWDNHRDTIDLVAVNNRSRSPEDHARLLRHDSVYGRFPAEVKAGDRCIFIGGHEIRVFKHEDPSEIDWDSCGVDIVIEATGELESREQAAKHLGGSVKKVIISSAGKGTLDLMTVLGVNHEDYDPEKHDVIANASCTTNCLAVMVKVMEDAFGIRHGIMTTVHSYTNDQRLQDGSHKDPRRARAAALSIIPTSTGAASAVGQVIPSLQGKLTGMALRVPTPGVSLVDLTLEMNEPVTVAQVNEAFRLAAEGSLKQVLTYETDDLVSVDFKGYPQSAVFDPSQTIVIDGTSVKIFGWYDNEYGYSCRLIDIAAYMWERVLVAA